MGRKNPIGRIADHAVKSLKNPVGTAGRMAKQAKGAADLGRSAAGQVGRTAMKTAGAAASRRKSRERGPVQAPHDEAGPPPLRAVPAEPGPPGGPSPHGDPLEGESTTSAKKASAKQTRTKTATPADVAQKAAKKAPAKKTAATKATARKTAAKKAPAKTTSPGDKLPPKKKAGNNPE